MTDEYTRNLVTIKNRAAELKQKIYMTKMQIKKVYFGCDDESDAKAKPEPCGLLEELDFIIKEGMEFAMQLDEILSEMGVYDT